MLKDAEKERVSGELNAAAKIQMGILPKLGMQYDEREECEGVNRRICGRCRAV